MALINVPEVTILEVLTKGLKNVRDNYTAATDKDKSWLGLTFKGQKIEKYDMFKEIVAMVMRDEDDPRFFQGDLMYNPKKNGLPSFHVTMPSETPSDGNTIGMGQGTEPDYMSDTFEEEEIVSTEVTEVYSRRIQTNYNIVVVSDNSIETVMLYHLMRAVLIASHMLLIKNGIEQLTFAGQDIQPYRELDHPLYMRAISMGVQYTSSVPALSTFQFLNDVSVSGQVIVGDE